MVPEVLVTKKINPLQTNRFYKMKNAHKSFLCALCTAPRSMKYSKSLSHKQVLQIFLISVTLSWSLYPVVGIESVFALFLVWPAFEIVNKLLYRREIACPYCGFDATWYRRDVVKANELVKNFWSKNYPDLVNPPVVESPEDQTIHEAAQTPEAPSQNTIN